MFGDGQGSQFVTAFVVVVSCVTLDPVPVDFVVLGEVVEGDPEIFVFYWAGAGFPVVLFPVFEPLGNTVSEVLGVCMEIDGAGAFEGGEGLNGCSHFHAVVGGFSVAAVEFFFLGATDEDGAPATHARVGFATSVCIYGYRSFTAHGVVCPI